MTLARPLARRAILGGGLGVLACGCAASTSAHTTGLSGGRGRIDVHYHLFPPEFVSRAPASANILRANPGIINWSLDKTLEEMERTGIERCVLSFPQPALWSLERDDQRYIARMANDFFAGLIADHSDRFALFAGLPPLDDVDGCLREIEYGYGTLKALGVRALTSYQTRWLGDPAFAPVWDELNSRDAIVFVHPDVANCCVNLGGVPSGYVEFPMDTARTMTSLWYTGALSRWPRIRFILSHGGGALLMVADRVGQFGRPAPEAGGSTVHDAMEQFRDLYFDTANAANAPALGALRAFARPNHVLFGTDAPFVDIQRQINLLGAAGFSRRELRAIERENAIALMPDLARAAAP